MKTFIFAILAIFGLFVSAAPTPAAEGADFEYVDPEVVAEHFNTSSTRMMTRTVGGIYICTGEYWTGTCGYKVQPLDMCIHLDSPWWHSISSFGPSGGTTCNWYSDYNCGSQLASGIVYPGVDDMNHENKCHGARGVDLDKRCYGDEMGSFKCWAT